MHIDDIWKNVFSSMALLEADCSKHKTSISKEAKTRLLPFVCLGRFLEAKSWGVSFMEARDHFGLSKPFLPSWNESTQTFGKHRMTTCEATCWIHELLEDGMSAKDALKFSSHSCKATLLTWAGMTTLFTREERTLLGHHVGSSNPFEHYLQPRFTGHASVQGHQAHCHDQDGQTETRRIEG